MHSEVNMKAAKQIKYVETCGSGPSTDPEGDPQPVLMAASLLQTILIGITFCFFAGVDALLMFVGGRRRLCVADAAAFIYAVQHGKLTYNCHS